MFQRSIENIICIKSHKKVLTQNFNNESKNIPLSCHHCDCSQRQKSYVHEWKFILQNLCIHTTFKCTFNGQKRLKIFSKFSFSVIQHIFKTMNNLHKTRTSSAQRCYQHRMNVD